MDIYRILMVGSVNKTILLGNLGRDPEIRSMQSGAKMASFSIATSKRWKDRNTQEQKEKTSWHNIVVFGDGLVDIVEKYVKKGSKIYVEGELQTRKWQDKDGIEKYSTDVISDNFTFVGSKSDAMGDAQFENQSPKNDDFNQTTSSNQDDDVPF